MQSQQPHRNLATYNLEQAFSSSEIAYLPCFAARKQDTLLCRYNKAPHSLEPGPTYLNHAFVCGTSRSTVTMSVSTTDLFGPPPLGLDLSENQSSKLITPVIVVLVFAVATVTLRVITRITTKSQKMEADDILILFGLVRTRLGLLVHTLTLISYSPLEMPQLFLPVCLRRNGD